MKQPLQDYMRVGIVQFMIFPDCLGGRGPQVETVQYLVQDGFFEVLEVGPIVDSHVRAEMISVMQQARVEAVYDGQPLILLNGLDPESPDEATRVQAINAMKRGVDEAVEFGSSTCGYMSGKAYPDDLDIDTAIERFVASTIELCTYAEPKGITIVMENFDRVPYSKDCLLGPTPQAALAAKMIREECANFGLLLDCSHLPILKETPRGMVEAGKDYVERIQIGNGSADPYSSHYGDDHPYFGAPLTGVSVEDLSQFLRALLDIDFLNTRDRPVVSFEVKPKPNEDPYAIIAGSKRALEQAWKMI